MQPHHRTTVDRTVCTHRSPWTVTLLQNNQPPVAESSDHWDSSKNDAAHHAGHETSKGGQGGSMRGAHSSSYTSRIAACRDMMLIKGQCKMMKICQPTCPTKVAGRGSKMEQKTTSQPKTMSTSSNTARNTLRD